MNAEKHKQMIARGKIKNDGIYTLAGVHYRVRDNRVTHYSDFGTLIEVAYGFNCVIGNYQWDMGDLEGVKLLRGIK